MKYVDNALILIIEFRTERDIFIKKNFVRKQGNIFDGSETPGSQPPILIIDRAERHDFRPQL